jgi:methionine-rich copper-binding protein CopC
VAITLEETGETIYASKGIKPGQYIQYIELAKDLEAGVYDATAMFTAYTEDTHQVVGNAGAEVTLYVEE